MTLESLCEGHEVGEKRRESLQIAIDLGADQKTLEQLRDAARIYRADYIVLPAHRYEGLSRGRGWARKGRGDSAVWGERTDDGYKVGPGRWTVGATDGFSRKATNDWTVKNIKVGDQIWTIAN